MNTGENRSPSVTATIREAIRSQLIDVHTMLPGKVKAYYPSKGTVDVDLTVKQRRRQPNGETEAIAFPTLMNIPLAFPRCASAWDTWPVAADDLVLVHFAERELGDWVQSGVGQVIDPGDGPTHTLNGAIAYLGGHPATHPITPTPSTSARVIHAENQLHLGGQEPSQFIALAGKVLDELTKIRTAMHNHTHSVVLGACTAGGGTGTVATINNPSIPALSEPASAKVKSL